MEFSTVCHGRERRGGASTKKRRAGAGPVEKCGHMSKRKAPRWDKAIGVPSVERESTKAGP